jgi:hypothetical protein
VWSFDHNFETERASREEIEAKQSSLKQNFVPAAEHSQKLTPDAATILNPRTRKGTALWFQTIMIAVYNN